MAMAELSPLQAKRRQERLLPKLASLAIRHADFLVATSCLVGLIALLILPVLAKNTYISENALIPGSANPKFSYRDAMNAGEFARDLQALSQNTTNPGMTIRSFLMKHLAAMDVDLYAQPFLPTYPTFSSINFVSSHRSSMRFCKLSAKDDVSISNEFGVNVAGIIRAPRGEGNEAIVLVTSYNSGSLADADAISLGLGLSLFQLLIKAPWLAKDIIWLAADSQYSLDTAVSAWLKVYHEPLFLERQSIFIKETILPTAINKPSASFTDDITLGDFKRAGVIGAGVVFNLQGIQGRLASDFLTVHAEGPNGQMPNLDLINVVNNLAVYREGLQMRLEMATNMLEWASLQIIGQVLEKVGQVAAMLNKGWKFGMPAFEYVQGVATLVRSMVLQARGIPTGAHGAFRDYQIDAVTIVMSYTSRADGGQVQSLLKFGRLLEGTLRSTNNLLEKFHQSFFLYFLTSPSKFVSVGIYTIPLLLLLVTLPLKAAALCSQMSGSSQSSSVVCQGKAVTVAAVQDQGLINWLFAVFTVLMFELWASTVAIFPPIAERMVESPDLKVAVWATYSGVSCILFFMILMWISGVLKISNPIGSNWKAIKASTLGFATIGLGIMSPINFAAALLGAVVLVPMGLAVCPTRKQKVIHQYLIGLSLSLICALLVPFSAIQQPSHMLDVIWNWVECQWKWGSATYLFVLLVHLPCLALCFILLVCNPES